MSLLDALLVVILLVLALTQALLFALFHLVEVLTFELLLDAFFV